MSESTHSYMDRIQAEIKLATTNEIIVLLRGQALYTPWICKILREYRQEAEDKLKHMGHHLHCRGHVHVGDCVYPSLSSLTPKLHNEGDKL